MMNKNEETKILLDSDVVRHFINGGQLSKLAAIFPNRFIMLDKVKNELLRSKNLVQTITDFLNTSPIQQLPFPTSIEIIIEYAYLTRRFGEGESACMAVAKHQRQYIASSNLNDIKEFCAKNEIKYYTTMDILVEAFKKNILTIEECNAFILDVKAKGSKLPVSSMEEYFRRESREL